MVRLRILVYILSQKESLLVSSRSYLEEVHALPVYCRRVFLVIMFFFGSNYNNNGSERNTEILIWDRAKRVYLKQYILVVGNLEFDCCWGDG